MIGLALVFVLAPAARRCDGVATFDDGGDRDCRLVFCCAMTCKNVIISIFRSFVSWLKRDICVEQVQTANEVISNRIENLAFAFGVSLPAVP